MSKPPLVRRSGLSGRFYVITSWHEEDGRVVSDVKHDVTDQVAPLLGDAWYRGFADCDAAEPGATIPNPYRPKE